MFEKESRKVQPAQLVFAKVVFRVKHNVNSCGSTIGVSRITAKEKERKPVQISGPSLRWELFDGTYPATVTTVTSHVLDCKIHQCVRACVRAINKQPSRPKRNESLETVHVAGTSPSMLQTGRDTKTTTTQQSGL